MARLKAVEAPVSADLEASRLAPTARDWLVTVRRDWELDAHHDRLAVLAAQALSRGELAQAVLDRDGLTYVDRFGQPKTRPEAELVRDSALIFGRLVRQLDLDAPPEPGLLALSRRGRRR